jgi:translocation and assembly module TamA
MTVSRLKVPAVVLALAVCGSGVRAADPQPYAVTIEGADSGEIRATLNATSELVSLQDKVSVPPFALVERARSDGPRLITALESFGYYAAKVTVTIDGHVLDDPELPGALDALSNGTKARVRVAIDKGPLYRLGDIAFEGAMPDAGRKALGLRSGDPAVAGEVLDARTRMIQALQEDGYALAKIDAPVALADDQAHVLNLTFKVDAGPQVDIGTISFKGLKDTNESFARHAANLKPGERYRPSRIEDARRALMAQGVFSGVSVRAADHLDADGRIPLTFDVQERKLHAVSLAANYSTDLGISLSATWSHRNLFGNAEQLNLTASGSGLGNSTAGIGYNLAAQFLKPMVWDDNQTLEFDAAGIKQNLDAYDQTAQTLAAFLKRRFSALWTARVGLSAMHDEVTQEGVFTIYELLAAPLTVSYDATGLGDTLNDPVKGVRASLVVTPTKAFGGSKLTFVVMQASSSAYFDLGAPGRSVLALRGLAASIIGGSNLDVPPDQRLYAGGSATVRGYDYQSIGPRFADGKPVGAKSVDAATVEFRQRIGEDWGAAAFVDAGQASDGAPFTGAVRVGGGIGARYYTPIGAVRADVAVPLTRGPGDAAFEIYIGLGQAF